MEEKKCIRQGNSLEVELRASSFSGDKEFYSIINSREYVINGLVVFQVKMNICRIMHPNTKDYSKYYASVNIKLRKTLKTDILTYAIKCFSSELKMSEPITLFTDDTPWRQIHEYNCIDWARTTEFRFKLTLELDLQSSSSSPLAYLLNDTDLTDFELRGNDGSVHVHKAILAGYSPVLQTLVAGDWREAKEGSVNVEGTTKETLQHLKDYMYNDKLPEKDLEQLMVLSKLASCYMMEDLVQKCSFKLLTKLSAQNAVELVEFATKYKQTNLFLAIIKHVECGYIKVKDIEDILFVEKAAENNEQIIT